MLLLRKQDSWNNETRVPPGERSGLSDERKLGRKGQERSSRGQEWSPRSQGDDSQEVSVKR